jgi:hypothetical protein
MTSDKHIDGNASIKREPMPQRRASFTHTFEAHGMRYEGTVGFYEDGRVGEIFLDSGKAGTASQVNARDAAIAVSHALQSGADFKAMRTSMTRGPDGKALGPVGLFLDLINEEYFGSADERGAA